MCIEVRGGAIIRGQRIHVAGDYRPVENGNKITIWKENGIFYEKFRDMVLLNLDVKSLRFCFLAIKIGHSNWTPE